MSGVERIAAARQKQLEVKGYTKENDQQYTQGQLVYAAMAYAGETIEMDGIFMWPWDLQFWEPAEDGDPIRNLERAGALIAAEIDRLEGPEKARDERPHSRACGWEYHPHGPLCSTNCPTCGGI